MKTITKANDIIFLDKVTKAENHRTQQYDFLSGGLTKREYFAAMAMQGLAANPFVTDVISQGLRQKIEMLNGLSDEQVIAKSAIQYADALIAELNKEVKS